MFGAKNNKFVHITLDVIMSSQKFTAYGVKITYS